MKKTQRYLVLGLLVIVYLLTVYIFLGESWQQNSFVQNSVAIACSILAPIMAFLIDQFLQNIKQLKLFWKTNVRLRNQKIRFSMSYIFRIRVNDKYLLVKNSKWNSYQPVGGVYKINSGEEKMLMDKFGMERDKKMNSSGVAKNDLRVFVPAKKALNFLRWFDSGKNREISHWREFYEELIGPEAEVLSIEEFPHIEYRFAGNLKTPLKYNKKWSCYELLSYDVYDLNPTPKQEEVLISLLEEGDTDYIKWADEKIIQSFGFDERKKRDIYEIGAHTKWTLNMEYE